LGKALEPRTTKYIPHRPTPKQGAFLILPQQETFYGGAAGGGKSDALLMAALQYVDVPGYAAILFRKTYADLSLPEALMDRATSWLGGTDARWNGTEKTWTFPSGATLTFGYMEHESDRYRYKSAAFQFIGFDELTQFTETQYTYLFSRLRRLKGSDVPLRMRSASNPGDIGHDWVKGRFVDSQDRSKIFIRAKLKDNPHLDEEAYIKSLNQLDPITRQQLLDGDWSARQSGGMFRREWFEIVDVAPADVIKVRYWDKASTEPAPGKDPDWTVGVLMGRTKQGLYYVLDVRRFRLAPLGVQTSIKQAAAMDTRGTSIWMEQEPGSSGVDTIDYYHRIVLPQYRFEGNKTTGSKTERAAPYSSQAQAGNVKLLRGSWNKDFLDEHEVFPNGSHDDQVDAASGAYEKLAQAVYQEPFAVFVRNPNRDYSGESMF
jgi:predicted phage terminase large subunit-like protein